MPFAITASPPLIGAFLRQPAGSRITDCAETAKGTLLAYRDGGVRQAGHRGGGKRSVRASGHDAERLTTTAPAARIACRSGNPGGIGRAIIIICKATN
jgi:hypothetical protein